MAKPHARNRTTTRPETPYDPKADIIRPRHIQQATGLHKATIWRLRRKGGFPEPIRLSDQAVGWRRSDVAAWLEARAGAR